MKFLLAFYGTRGDVEPGVAVGRELLNRGHDVRLAVPPDLGELVEAVGAEFFPYGAQIGTLQDAMRDYWALLFRAPWRVSELNRLKRRFSELAMQRWGEMASTLTSLADGVDLLFNGLGYMEPAANTAEFYNIPFATLHTMPARPNGQLLPFLPSPLARGAMTVNDWFAWRSLMPVEEAQRHQLGLPRATSPASRRIADRGSIEVQAYDRICFPGLVNEWAEWKDKRPIVGALTLELPTDTDEEVMSWITAGKPPIYFGFGSVPVGSPADTIAMISSVCDRLGERALVGAAGTSFRNTPDSENIKVVGTFNHSAIFPACRAIVHHGGAGTTAASLRAGVPTLILWTLPDQPIWGGVLKRLKVGTTRRFSTITEQSLLSDLRVILQPRFAVRAREVAAQLTKPADSVTAAADLLETLARAKHMC